MTGFFGLIVLCLVLLFLFWLKTRNKFSLGILLVVLFLPLIMLILTKSAQQGKVFPHWGKLSLLIFKPKDLWQPLAQAELIADKNIYEFSLIHKYVGNHSLDIIFADEDIDVWQVETKDLLINLKILEDGREIFAKKAGYIGCFSGLIGKGLYCIKYSLPEDAPINKRLKMEIEINIDIQSFINQYGHAKIVIKKSSDL